MRGAVITTLKALYEGKKVTATQSIKCDTTRITNEISTLRNVLGIDIITDRINTKDRKWFGSYRLIRTKENLKRVRALLEQHSKKDEVQKSQN
jgi:hypothetical protein